MRLSINARKFHHLLEPRSPAHANSLASIGLQRSSTHVRVQLHKRVYAATRRSRPLPCSANCNLQKTAASNQLTRSQPALRNLAAALSPCKANPALQLAACVQDGARPKASISFFKRMRRSIRVALRGRSPRKQRRDANSKWRSLVRRKDKERVDDKKQMAMLAQKMERARLDNDSAECQLFQLDMPEDSDESNVERHVVTPSASLEEPDGMTVIQQPYDGVRRVSRDSQDDDADDAWGQFLDLEDDEPRSPSRSPAILIVPQLSASIDVPRPRAPLCF